MITREGYHACDQKVLMNPLSELLETVCPLKRGSAIGLSVALISRKITNFLIVDDAMYGLELGRVPISLWSLRA